MKYLLAIVLLISSVFAQNGLYSHTGSTPTDGNLGMRGNFTQAGTANPQFGFINTATGEMGCYVLVPVEGPRPGADYIWTMVGWRYDEDGVYIESTGTITWNGGYFGTLTFSLDGGPSTTISRYW